jgi:hypothetical protein
LLIFIYNHNIMKEKLDLHLYKWVIWILKIIPIVLTIICMLNILLSYYNIDLPFLSYLMVFILFIFIYLASYAFKFCKYHRLFLHYVTINWLLNIIDYYWGIPVSNKEMLMIYVIIIGIFIFLLLYIHLRDKKLSNFISTKENYK